MSAPCPTTGEIVPVNFVKQSNEVETLWLVPLGFTGHGKTTYISVLTHMIESLGRVFENVYSEILDQSTMTTIREMRIAASMGLLPNSTAVQSNYRPLLFNIYNLPQLGSRSLALYDVPGEVDQTSYRILAHCKTPWFFISLSDLHDDKDGKTITQLFDMYHAATQKTKSKLKDRSLIIVYTKAEVEPSTNIVKDYLRKDPFRLLMDYNRSGGDFNSFSMTDYLYDMNEMSNHLREFTRNDVEFGADFINKVESQGVSLRFCVTSALGQSPDDGSLRFTEGIRGFRVLDPVFSSMILGVNRNNRFFLATENREIGGNLSPLHFQILDRVFDITYEIIENTLGPSSDQNNIRLLIDRVGNIIKRGQNLDSQELIDLLKTLDNQNIEFATQVRLVFSMDGDLLKRFELLHHARQSNDIDGSDYDREITKLRSEYPSETIDLLIRLTLPVNPYKSIADSLVVGVGGAGIEIIRLVKKQITQNTESFSSDVTRFLAVDTVPVENYPGREKISPDEIIYIGGYDISLVLKSLDSYPEIKRWWPHGQSNKGSLHRGARQDRNIGRLSLYVRWSDFRARLDHKTGLSNEILRDKILNQDLINSDKQNHTTVFVVASLCGGTGAGTCFDIACKIRKDLGEDANIVGVFLMPSCFNSLIQSSVQQKRTYVNTYAALLEITRWGSHSPYMTYFPGENQTELDKIFDQVFLIDNIDRGHSGNLHNIYDAVAHFIYSGIEGKDRNAYPYGITVTQFFGLNDAVRINEIDKWHDKPTRDILLRSESIRQTMGTHQIYTEYIMTALFHDEEQTHKLLTLFENEEFIIPKLEELVNKMSATQFSLKSIPASPMNFSDDLPLSDNTAKTLAHAFVFAYDRSLSMVQPQCLLIGLLAISGAIATNWIEDLLQVEREILFQICTSSPDLILPLDQIRKLSNRSSELNLNPEDKKSESLTMLNSHSFRIHIGMRGSDNLYSILWQWPGHAEHSQKVDLESALSFRLSYLYSDWDQGVALGRTLFENIFTGDIRRMFIRSLEYTQKQNTNLRIWLRIEPPELQPLPWELLHDGEEFLALQRKVSIIRQPSSPVSVALRDNHGLLRMIYASANGVDREKLDLDRSQSAVVEALTPLTQNNILYIDTINHATLERLSLLLRQIQPQIFHFDGNSIFRRDTNEGLLVLEDENSISHLIKEQHLVELMNQSNLKLIVLNSCESAATGVDSVTGLTQALTRSGVPVVIGLLAKPSDQSAIAFNQGFYSALAKGHPIDSAVMVGRQSMLTASAGHRSLDWSTPVIFSSEERSLSLIGSIDIHMPSSSEHTDIGELEGIAKPIQIWLALSEDLSKEIDQQGFFEQLRITLRSLRLVRLASSLEEADCVVSVDTSGICGVYDLARQMSFGPTISLAGSFYDIDDHRRDGPIAYISRLLAAFAKFNAILELHNDRSGIYLNPPGNFKPSQSGPVSDDPPLYECKFSISDRPSAVEHDTEPAPVGERGLRIVHRYGTYEQEIRPIIPIPEDKKRRPTLWLDVTNDTLFQLHCCLIAVDPSESVDRRFLLASDWKQVAPGETIAITRLHAGLSEHVFLSKETLKLIVADSPIDLRQLQQINLSLPAQELEEQLLEELASLNRVRWCAFNLHYQLCAAWLPHLPNTLSEAFYLAERFARQRGGSTIGIEYLLWGLYHAPSSLLKRFFELTSSILDEWLKNPQTAARKEALSEALQQLPERERKIIQLRYGLRDGRYRTYEEVGLEFGMTGEQMRQIEANALHFLRNSPQLGRGEPGSFLLIESPPNPDDVQSVAPKSPYTTRLTSACSRSLNIAAQLAGDNGTITEMAIIAALQRDPEVNHWISSLTRIAPALLDALFQETHEPGLLLSRAQKLVGGGRYLDRAAALARIRIVRGDLLAFKADAIVQGVGLNPLHGGQLGDQLIERLGNELQHTLEYKERFHPAEVLVSGPWPLPSPIILHACVQDNAGAQTEASTIAAVCSALETAETVQITPRFQLPIPMTSTRHPDELHESNHYQRVRTIAFPSHGTGAGGLDVDRLAQSVLSRTIEHLQYGSSLEQVSFVCYSREDYHGYLAAYQKLGGSLVEAVPLDRLSFDSAISAFLYYQETERNSSDAKIKQYQNDLEQFRDFLENQGTDWVVADRRTLRRFVAILQDASVSRRIIGRKLSCLRSFYRFHQREKQASVIASSYKLPEIDRQTALKRLDFTQTDFLELRGDIYLHSTSPNLSLRGVTGQKLFRRLGVRDGAALADRLKLLAPVPLGNVIVSPIENLLARYLIHMPIFDKNEPTPQTIQQALTAALLEAEALDNVKTLVVPSIATSWPGEIALKAVPDILETVLKHLEQGSQLDQIIFANPDPMLHEAFLAAYQALAEQLKETETGRHSIHYQPLLTITPNPAAVGQRVGLRVDLLPTRGAADSIVLPEGIVDVRCFVSADGFSVENNAMAIERDQSAGHFQTVSFNLYAQLRGKRTIVVDFFVEDLPSTTLVRATAEVEVLAPQADLEEPLPILPMIEVRQTDLILEVQSALDLADPNAYHLHYRLTTQSSLSLHQQHVGSTLLRSSDLDRMQAIISRAMYELGDAQPEDRRSSLLSAGSYLYDMLFPAASASDFRRIYGQIADQMHSWLIVEQSAGWLPLPWELVAPYDDDTPPRLLGEQHMLGRRVMGFGTTLYREVPIGEIALAYYTGVSGEEVIQNETMPAWQQLLKARYISQGIVKLVNSDEPIYGVHILSQRGDGSTRRAIVPREGRSEADSLHAEANQAKLGLHLKRPVVGLSIQGDTQSTLEENIVLLEGALPFIQTGASAVVMPWWTTSTEADVVFWPTFYDLLSRRLPLGEVMRQARLAVYRVRPSDPSWITYTLFGHPSARGYWPEVSEGYTVLECLNPDQPLRVGKTYTFRASIRRRPPLWQNDRLVEVENLPQAPKVVFRARGCELTVTEPIDMTPYGRTMVEARVGITPTDPGVFLLTARLYDGDERLQVLQLDLVVEE